MDRNQLRQKRVFGVRGVDHFLPAGPAGHVFRPWTSRTVGITLRTPHETSSRRSIEQVIVTVLLTEISS